MVSHLNTYGLPEKHLSAIGSVCVGWSILDTALSTLLLSFLQEFDTRPLHIFTGEIQIRERIKLARFFAHERMFSKDDLVQLDWILTQLDSPVRPERNRIVHDVWGATGPSRLQMKPKFVKQPHLPKELVTIHEVPMTDDEIRDFEKVIGAFLVSLTHAGILHQRDVTDGHFAWHDISNEPYQALNHYLGRMKKEPVAPPMSSQG